MYIVAAYRHSMAIELVISDLEAAGIHREHILAIPLDRRDGPLVRLDSMHKSDGHSLLDLSFSLGTIGMLLGTIYGFVLPLGPIIWGLIGLVGGCAIGYAVKWLLLRHRGYRIGSAKDGGAEVFLMIHCSKSNASWAEKLIWKHQALGVGTMKDEGER